MDLKTFVERNSCFFPVLGSIFLTCSYVGSLYIWKYNQDRNHPSVIKRRFVSVSCVMVMAPFVTNYLLGMDEESVNGADLYTAMGLRLPGIINALVLPLLLTVILFLGPLTLQYYSGIWKIYAEPMYWWSNWQELGWVRNHVVAPLSEEWVFRGCMMPLLLQCLPPRKAILVGPLLFGVAHLHHIVEQMSLGVRFKVAFLTSTFQFLYTSLFGIYSAYLFARTGHLVAPLMAHVFCNHMGFPALEGLGELPPARRALTVGAFFLGLGVFCLLLRPLTDPTLYDNQLHWH